MNDREDGERKDNVILFPKTIQYYQVQLTRMLEQEQYAEAIQLLRFLLQSQGDDRRVYEEWKLLLDWLQAQFDMVAEDEEHSAEQSESRMLARHVQAKLESDKDYIKKLLDMLLTEHALEKKFIALDQLVYIDHPQINETLIRWVETVDLHPLAQFKVLQTLKLRDVSETIKMQRHGEHIVLNLADVPLAFEDYPRAIIAVLERVQHVSEVNHPALGYFADQTWKAFLSYQYGTGLYDHLSELDEDGINIWAAALHDISLQTMLGGSDAEDVFAIYGLASDHVFQWEQACRFLKQFMQSAFNFS